MISTGFSRVNTATISSTRTMAAAKTVTQPVNGAFRPVRNIVSAYDGKCRGYNAASTANSAQVQQYAAMERVPSRSR